MNENMPSVFLIDDDPSVRKGLTRLLASSGYRVAAFGSAAEFLAQHVPTSTGCLLLDLAMPGLNGIEMQQALIERGSLLSVVFLTGHGDIHSSVRAMKLGAVDFLTKPADKDELLAAVAQALERNAKMRKDHEQRAVVERLLDQLTPREREVLGCLASGRRNKQIAADLGTVEKTIKVHRARVLHKMQVRTLAELIQMVSRAGIDVLSVKEAHPERRAEAHSAPKASERPSTTA